MDYEIAIPSYKRPETIKKKTYINEPINIKHVNNNSLNNSFDNFFLISLHW